MDEICATVRLLTIAERLTVQSVETLSQSLRIIKMEPRYITTISKLYDK